MSEQAFAVQYCGRGQYDVQHVPMSLIRDKDHCCYIIGILPVASCLSFVTIMCYWCCALAALVLYMCVRSVAPPSTLCNCWVVCHTHLHVRAILRTFVSITHSVLNRVASLQFSAWRKQSVASDQQSRHNDVRRQSLKATTRAF